jgi:hypothetical protein
MYVRVFSGCRVMWRRERGDEAKNLKLVLLESRLHVANSSKDLRRAYHMVLALISTVHLEDSAP